ncbi:1-aminocyclopropane-1-carboxylate deaminase/D-cysteine desulfhydrase [Thiomicrorhabdus hydrogeniphila]
MIAHKKLYTTPLTRLYSTLFDEYNIEVYVKRDDLNHPSIQGNKWHKLKHNLQQAKINKATTLITFGGAYSNHIAATAYAAKAYGFKSIGIIRGNELADSPEKWSPTLKTAQQNGMEFQFISRQNYRQKESETYLNELRNKYPNSYILPEGGTNELAILGFEDLIADLQQQCPNWTHLFCPVGTGGTLAGLSYFTNKLAQTNMPSLEQGKDSISPLNTNISKQVIGIAVLKEAEYLNQQITDWLAQLNNKHSKRSKHHQLINWNLLTQYHDGGYAKTSKLGLKNQQDFEKTFGIPLDPVYTSKMIFAFYEQLKMQAFPKNSKIILLHTGGLQGRNKL